MSFIGLKNIENLLKKANLSSLDENYEIKEEFLSNPGDLLAFLIKPEVKTLINDVTLLNRKIKEAKVVLSGLMTEESDKFINYSNKLKEEPDFKQKDDVMNESIIEAINIILENTMKLNEFYESRK